MVLFKPNGPFSRIKRGDISPFTITLQRGWSSMAVLSNLLELHENAMATFSFEEETKAGHSIN